MTSGLECPECGGPVSKEYEEGRSRYDGVVRFTCRDCDWWAEEDDPPPGSEWNG